MAMTDGMGVMPVYNLDGNNNSNGGAFGDGGMWIFFLFFLLAWGGGGFGGFGGGAGYGYNQINNDFLYTNLSSQIRDNSIQNDMLLNSIQQGLCSANYEQLKNYNNLSSQIADCCCTTQKELLINRYEAEKNTASIVNAIHTDGEATRAMLTQNTIQELRDRLQNAEFANSQAIQTANIVNQVRPFPVPAYITCSPYASTTAISNYSPCASNQYFV